MTHVWQWQNSSPPVYWWSARNRTYAYTLDTSKSLRDYAMEQQAEIMMDYFYLTKGKIPTKVDRYSYFAPKLGYTIEDYIKDYEKVIGGIFE